jgi:N utilization substance protein B
MSRRAAREAALQILYQADIAGRDIDVERDLAYWMEELAADGDQGNWGDALVPQTGENVKHKILSGENYDFALSLIRGTLDHCGELDEKINVTAREWDLKRMDVVDRNVMRLALYEMFFCPNIPQRVSVNEAVELSKTFCGQDSAKFINGILDRFILAEER